MVLQACDIDRIYGEIDNDGYQSEQKELRFSKICPPKKEEESRKSLANTDIDLTATLFDNDDDTYDFGC